MVFNSRVLGSWIFVGFLFVAAFVATRYQASAPRENTTREPAQAFAENSYCVAIRGNGELIPAHWAALARIIENIGLPVGQAGGSSASVTMYLLDSMITSKFLSEDPTKRPFEVSLMLKSVFILLDLLRETPEAKNLLWAAGKLLSSEYGGGLADIMSSAKGDDKVKFFEAIATAEKIGLLDKNHLNKIKSLYLGKFIGDGKKILSNYLEELKTSASVFGKFDAQDPNLFLRPGIVDFNQIARSVTQIAAFYSGDFTKSYAKAPQLTAELQSRWKDLFDTCAEKEKGNLMIQASCQKKFADIWKLFSSNKDIQSSPQKSRRISQSILSIPTTAVITGQARDEVKELFKEYERDFDNTVGTKFKIREAQDIRFGYWGKNNVLEALSKNLQKNDDEKSKRFFALGDAYWEDVLALSPAEPGLASLKGFRGESLEGKALELYSAGGWSDLHPVQILKAAGCPHVVFVTRQGGESMFAQGIAQRLLNLDISQKELNPWDEETKKINAEGRDPAQYPQWSRLFNMKDKKSAIQQALARADSVYCTRWNDYTITKPGEFNKLVANAYYESAVWVNPMSSFSGNSKLRSPPLTEAKADQPGCSPNDLALD